MISFKNYLVEAEFSEDNFTRVLSAFERRLPKLLGTSIYRFGGSSGTVKLSGATGYLYFFKDRAFQVRAKGSHVVGIDVWDTYSIDKGPSFTIDVADLNAETLIGSMGKLARYIKNPSVGDHSLSESIVSEMAKRVADTAFYKLAQDEYSAEQLQKLSWEQIKNVADQNDVLIPAYIKQQKVGKGQWSVVPSSTGSDKSEAADDGAKPSSKSDPILYIKITAQDPDSKKFVSAGNDKRAQQLYKDIQASLDGPPPEAELKDPETLYGHLAQLVSFAAKGKLRSLLIYGGPGTGKTFTIMKTVKDEGLVPNKDYVKLSGKASPIAIYETLFMFRDGGLVIFDDLDSMWRNEDATNILKAALDTSPVREISWSSANTINVSKMSDEKREALFKQIDKQINGEDEEPEEDDSDDGDDENDGKKKKEKKPAKALKVKYPSTFEFKGRVIFISNLKKEEFDSAIMSRSAKIGMDMTPEQILQRMRSILPTLGGDDVSIEKKEELLDQLLKMHKNREIDQITMREFTKGLDIVRSGAPNWRDLVIYA